MNKGYILVAVAGVLLAMACSILIDQGCMARRDYGRSVHCAIAHRIVETLAPQAR